MLMWAILILTAPASPLAKLLGLTACVGFAVTAASAAPGARALLQRFGLARR
jgi:hypothetical protein